VRGQAGADDPVVVGEDLCVSVITKTPQQRGGALDIGERKGERCRGQSLREARHGRRRHRPRPLELPVAEATTTAISPPRRSRLCLAPRSAPVRHRAVLRCEPLLGVDHPAGLVGWSHWYWSPWSRWRC
jgi:hypothetical protein